MAHIVTLLISTTLIMCLAFSESDGTDDLLCNKAMFDHGVHNHCVPIYKNLMATINYQDECPWPNTQHYYYYLDYCVESVVSYTACKEPSLKNKIFLDLHRTYFSHCHFLKDPDVPVLMLFTLPCIVITVLIPFFCICLTTLGETVND